MYIFYYFLYSVYYVFYNLMYHVGLTVLAIVVCQIVWNRLPTDLKLLRSTASFKSELESFLVSCCLHWEHCVNSGMRHRSECRGHTTSHCCYCYCNSPNKRNLRQHQKNQHTEKHNQKTSYPGWPGQETKWPTLYRLRDHTGQATG